MEEGEVLIHGVGWGVEMFTGSGDRVSCDGFLGRRFILRGRVEAGCLFFWGGWSVCVGGATPEVRGNGCDKDEDGKGEKGVSHSALEEVQVG
ncbi:hypothetical protein [Rubritalea tangerina]|uniref:hypothetical protein n=1 Tax=Rubritalea tangerina TaxID=430798 RepID=UPI0036177B13